MKIKINLNCLLSIVALCAVLSTNAFGGSSKPTKPRHTKDTMELITLVNHDPQIKNMLIKSIASAKKINPDKMTNPAQTLEEYYNFVDWASKALPWTILPHGSYSTLFDQIDQGLDYFYFINDQPLAELKGKGYFNNSLQYHEPYRTWLINFTRDWGMFLSTKASWNHKYYKRAFADKRFGLQNGWYEAPSHWKTFNDFFTRYLKSPKERPIASPNNSSIVVSPADSKPQGVWEIDKTSNFVEHDGVVLKSKKFQSIPFLLGKSSAYKNAFSNGTLTHTFLNVNDYHRYHFPLGGKIKEVNIIEADDAAGGITKWDNKRKKYILKEETPGWQSTQTRGCVIIQTKHYGLVALLPIGMSQVNSVNFEKTVKVGHTVKKGDMLGYFLFGGSDFVILFQSKVDFKLTMPKKHDGTYKHVLMGENYGILTKRHKQSSKKTSNR
ncbi:MAG: phosphatidylserine decarboxylase [Psychromonas sp.]|nr:phosphatidylserine decarboxylase [Psychromonas sp.]